MRLVALESAGVTTVGQTSTMVSDSHPGVMAITGRIRALTMHEGPEIT
jgi:hypothetical protein